jgi:hypothetical protein
MYLRLDRRWYWTLALSAMLLGSGAVGASVCIADNVVIPHVFTPGTAARATEMNENFSRLADAANLSARPAGSGYFPNSVQYWWQSNEISCGTSSASRKTIGTVPITIPASGKVVFLLSGISGSGLSTSSAGKTYLKFSISDGQGNVFDNLLPTAIPMLIPGAENFYFDLGMRFFSLDYLQGGTFPVVISAEAVAEGMACTGTYGPHASIDGGINVLGLYFPPAASSPPR